jgi:hypothetical protein
MCEYAFYGKEESRPQIYCKLNNQVCLFSKFCVNEGRYIHKEGAENCYMIEREKKKKIPNGSYYVRFILKGYAYVELSSDKVIKVKDTLGNIENYVYLKFDNGEYIPSLTPFTEEKLKTSRKKK